MQNDTHLVEAIRKGDQNAWTAVVEAHQQPVFRLAYLIAGDPADAEDIAQETFIRAYRSLARFDKTRPLRPWLLAIAANLARNRQRSVSRYLSALGNWRKVQAEPAPIERIVNKRTDSDSLWRAIRRLSSPHQAVLYLRFFLELSVEETAQSLETTAGTVKSRTARAVGSLREIIREEFPELEHWDES